MTAEISKTVFFGERKAGFAYDSLGAAAIYYNRLFPYVRRCSFKIACSSSRIYCNEHEIAFRYIFMRELTHLPIIVDPSHATGIARLVPPMALAATAGGADGLIIEVHNDPIHALCDGAQSLRPEEYDELAKQIMKIREVVAK